MATGKRKKIDIEKEELETQLKPNCTICLQEYSNRTFLRPCFHSFCFYCIKSWINVANSVCPICRQSISSLVYNIDENENDFDEYCLKDKGSKAAHEPPLTKKKPVLSPEERIRLERSKIYKAILKPVSYPEVLAKHENFTIITPEYIPRTRVFLQNELKITLGQEVFDSFIEDHFIQILLIPYNSKKKSMYDPAIIKKLSEWLDDDTNSMATILLNELIAFLKSGLSYRQFISTAMYK